MNLTPAIDEIAALKEALEEACRRRFNIDHLCRLNIDQGLKLAA